MLLLLLQLVFVVCCLYVLCLLCVCVVVCVVFVGVLDMCVLVCSRPNPRVPLNICFPPRNVVCLLMLLVVAIC